MTNSIIRNLHLCFSQRKKRSPHLVVHEETHHPNPVRSSPTSSPPTTTSVFKDVSSLSVDTGSTSASAAFFTFTPESSSVAGDRDLSSAIACRRLLLPSSPGSSNAIADPATIAVGLSVAVPTYSDDPYMEFRRSMEEMAGATGLLDPLEIMADCSRRQERLHELLLCYLALNRKHAHKYIISAFSDLFLISSESAAMDGAGTPRGKD